MAIYAELLPKEASAADCSHYCGPVAICLRLVPARYVDDMLLLLIEYSAQLLLEQSSYDPASDTEPSSDFNHATEQLTAIMVHMVEEINAEIAATNWDLLRPLALYSIYQVAQIYVRLCQRHPEPKYKHGIRVLLQSLGYFDQRWRLAGMSHQVHSTMRSLHTHKASTGLRSSQQ